jgi:hypothetical protein
VSHIETAAAERRTGGVMGQETGPPDGSDEDLSGQIERSSRAMIAQYRSYENSTVSHV